MCAIIENQAIVSLCIASYCVGNHGCFDVRQWLDVARHGLAPFVPIKDSPCRHSKETVVYSQKLDYAITSHCTIVSRVTAAVLVAVIDDGGFDHPRRAVFVAMQILRTCVTLGHSPSL